MTGPVVCLLYAAGVLALVLVLSVIFDEEER